MERKITFHEERKNKHIIIQRIFSRKKFPWIPNNILHIKTPSTRTISQMLITKFHNDKHPEHKTYETKTSHQENG